MKIQDVYYGKTKRKVLSIYPVHTQYNRKQNKKDKYFWAKDSSGISSEQLNLSFCAYC